MPAGGLAAGRGPRHALGMELVSATLSCRGGELISRPPRDAEEALAALAPHARRHLERLAAWGMGRPRREWAEGKGASALEEAGFVVGGTQQVRCAPYWADLVVRRAWDDEAARAGLASVEQELGARGSAAAFWRMRLRALGGRDVDAVAARASWPPALTTPVAYHGAVDLPSSLRLRWVEASAEEAMLQWTVDASTRVAMRWRATQAAPADSRVAVDFAFAWALDHALRGQVVPSRPGSVIAAVADALTAFFADVPLDVARKAFAAARRTLREAQGGSTSELPGPLGLFHAVVELGADLPRGLRLAGRVARHAWRMQVALDLLGFAQPRDDDEDDPAALPLVAPADDRWGRWAELYARRWGAATISADLAAAAESLAEDAARSDWICLEADLRRLVEALAGRPVPPATGRDLVELRRYRARWERDLDALEAAAKAVARKAPPTGATDEPRERVAWHVYPLDGGLRIDAFRQRRGARGWTKGKRLSPKAFADAAHEPWLDADDQRMLRHVVRRSGPWSGHHWADEAALGLVGHPRVFDTRDPSRPIRLRQAKPRLVTRRAGEGLTLALDPPYEGRSLTVREGPGVRRWTVTSFVGAAGAVAEVVGSGLEVPAAALPRVQRLLGELSAELAVEGDVGADGHAEEVAPDARPYLRLARDGEGIAIRARAQPLGPEGPAMPLGSGADVVAAEVAAARRQATRDHGAERAAFAAVVSQCADLEGWADPGAAWRVPSLEASLRLLMRLAALVETEAVAVTWDPQGDPLRIAGEVETKHLRLEVTTAEEWLALGGRVEVREDLVVELEALLDGDHRRGRFMEIGPQQFVALADDVRALAELLGVYAERHRGRLRMPVAALAALGDVLPTSAFDGLGRERLDAARAALEATPAVPRTFDGELRGYQLDGFRWLARRAGAGLGACLADDMGLGKTVQILALLVHAASRGPSLVVAPTSVVAQWRTEARRFAPTLRPIDLATADDRVSAVRAAGPRDLLLVGYGLLPRVAETLATVPFEVAVLDEAQAIKNPRTQRARAAFSLRARARVAATGTPIQNRVGELYSIFRFLQPGLLGSAAFFRERFAKPIEREGDATAARRLRKRLEPFLLRRTKSAVLDELPPRTDVTLRIDAGDEEAALYEALRREALDTLEEQREHGDDRDTFQILAALTRLRRACCHPSLVAPAGRPMRRGAKLERLTELVRDLVEAGHRCLVFSQFVDVLTLVRERFDEADLTYQYLDGSTPAARRARAVDAFQGGEGDAFLISTQAGGFGLNLTGADYVIHVDPWWNPAVEDQASDRAHRIGQRRPVTVYRLVMAGTIEEQIVSLHERKRAIADRLLADADEPRALDLDAIVDLLRRPEPGSRPT